MDDSLAEAKRRYEEEIDRAKKRAERFGKPYVAPNVFNPILGIGSKSEIVQVLKQQKGETGVVTGFDPLADDERKKAEARAARFGIGVSQSNVYEKIRFEQAGLSDLERNLREERRRRAQRFGKDDELDLNLAKAAAIALEDDPLVVIAKHNAAATAAAAAASSSSSAASSAEGEGEGAVAAAPAPAPLPLPMQRFNALHVRGQGYLPCASADLYRFFGDTYKPTYIEWLNGVSLNAIFADAGTAKRAYEAFTEEVPKLIAPPAEVAEALPYINAAGYRVALKPLIKGKTDKWAAAGTQTTIYLRFATTDDTKEKAPGTTGHRTHGTFSKHGEYSIKRQNNTAMDEDSDDDNGNGNGSGAGASGAGAGAGTAEGADVAMADSAAAAAAAPQEPKVKLTKDGKLFKSAQVKDLHLASVSAAVVSQLHEAAKHLQKRQDAALPDGFRNKNNNNNNKKKEGGESESAADGAAAGSAATEDGADSVMAVSSQPQVGSKRKRRATEADDNDGDEIDDGGRDNDDDVRASKRRRGQDEGEGEGEGEGMAGSSSSSASHHPLLRTDAGAGADAGDAGEEAGQKEEAGTGAGAVKGRGRGRFKADPSLAAVAVAVEPPAAVVLAAPETAAGQQQ